MTCLIITALVICISLGALRWHAYRQHLQRMAEMTARGDELDAILCQLRQLSAAGMADEHDRAVQIARRWRDRARRIAD